MEISRTKFFFNCYSCFKKVSIFTGFSEQKPSFNCKERAFLRKSNRRVYQERIKHVEPDSTAIAGMPNCR